MGYDRLTWDGKDFEMAERKATFRRAPHRPELRALLDRVGSVTPIAFHRLGSGARP